ncbi:YitT family protein [Lachnospiraceae bacterium 62-35]
MNDITKDIRKNTTKTAWQIVCVIIGNTIMALGSGGFVIPSGLMTGGATGLGIAVGHFTHIPVALAVGVLNLILFFIGAWTLGKAFALTTMASTFYFPVALGQVQALIKEPITQDPMLAAITGGMLTGLGIGIVIRAGSSTGGLDIPPLIMKKKLGIPVSVSMYILDCAVLLVQMTFSSLEMALYSLILILVYTVVIDKITTIGLNQMQVKIISREYETINQAIQTVLDRGTTLVSVKGGYMKKETYEIMVILSGRELVKLNELVMDYDPQAFMVINKVNEVRGRGFTLHKKHGTKSL